jgi:3-dehydroquinate synthase
MKVVSSPIQDVEVGNITESSLGEILDNYSNRGVIIIVDQNTHDLCLEFLITTFPQLKKSEIILLPVGEENKVMEVCMQVWNAFSEYGFGRKDLVLNLGGGVVTDMGGFLASVYKRGMDFIHIPTSLLGMIDASIGGKNGIDLNQYKNQLGTITAPKRVFVDPIFMETLPEAEFYNGYAEMLKYALIRDKLLFEEIKDFSKENDFSNIDVIVKCIQIKVDIVDGDLYEKASRKLLNFGHTVGHAIEGYFLESVPISHGHAVALGMCAEAYLSMDRGDLSKEEYKQIEGVLTRVYPFIKFSDEDTKSIIELMYNDKKNESGKIYSVLLKEIGVSTFHNELSEKEIGKALLHISMLSDIYN